MSAPIVVTGLGFVTPLGTGAQAVWNAWVNGDSGVRRLGRDDPRLARGVDPTALPEVGRAGFVRGFQPREHIRSPHLRRMDWCSRMIVACATQAVRDAELSFDDEDAQIRTGLVIGSCFGNQRETQTYMTRVLRQGAAAGQPILFPNLVLNAAAGYAAIELSVRGPNLSVSEHEASGEIAVVAAVDLLRSGQCDRVIVGGVDEFGALYLSALRERRLLDAESAPGAPRKDARRGRIIPGEGAAAFVLERQADAYARGRVPHAAIGEARSGAVRASPYAAPEPRKAADRLLRLLETPGTPVRPVSAVIGGANGSRLRDDLDRTVLDAIEARQSTPASYVRLDPLVGDWPARGALAVALGSLALSRGSLPGSTPLRSAPLERIFVPGSGRSGVLVSIAIDVLASSQP